MMLTIHLGTNMNTWIDTTSNWPNEIENEEGEYYWIATKLQDIYFAELIEYNNNKFLFVTPDGQEYTRSELVDYYRIDQPYFDFQI